jgi:hypothetical protein
MKLARADLALFRWPMLLLAVALALMSLLVWASHGEYQRSQARAKEAERANMRARSELLEVRAQETNYRSFSSQFELLEGRGLTGEERRLDWIDMVQRLRERHRLYTLEYEISAQRNFVASLAPPTGLNPRSSAVALQFTALHEGDLIRFLDELEQQSPGVFRQTRCDIARLPVASADAAGARLNARCEYDWLTLKASGS